MLICNSRQHFNCRHQQLSTVGDCRDDHRRKNMFLGPVYVPCLVVSVPLLVRSITGNVCLLYACECALGIDRALWALVVRHFFVVGLPVHPMGSAATFLLLARCQLAFLLHHPDNQNCLQVFPEIP